MSVNYEYVYHMNTFTLLVKIKMLDQIYFRDSIVMPPNENKKNQQTPCKVNGSSSYTGNWHASDDIDLMNVICFHVYITSLSK